MEGRNILIYFSLKYKGDWEAIYNAIKEKEPIDEAEANDLLKGVKSSVITILDENYPDTLKQTYRPPFVLYYHGDISLLDCKYKSISVVGSRICSNEGIRNTYEIVGELAKELIIVSGLAMGIDSHAHMAALKAKGKTIAVLGCGINYVYPEENRDLYNEIKKKGLVLSEYPNSTLPNPKYFPIRNRIVAGLTNCVFVPEAKKLSGTSITVTLMCQNGGDVCACPTKRGKDSLCNYLIQNGACLVETVDDIYCEMNYKKHEPVFEEKIS